MDKTIEPRTAVADPTATRVLAALLERMDNTTEPVDAQQYHAVVSRLAEALGQARPGDELAALLDQFPAASQVYENLQYQYAGLCRSALDPSLAAEQQVQQLFERVKNRGA